MLPGVERDEAPAPGSTGARLMGASNSIPSALGTSYGSRPTRQAQNASAFQWFGEDVCHPCHWCCRRLLASAGSAVSQAAATIAVSTTVKAVRLRSNLMVATPQKNMNVLTNCERPTIGNAQAC